MKFSIPSLICLLLLSLSVHAQDTLMLLNGKKLVVKSVDLKDYEIAYRTLDKNSKLKRMDPERVFSVVYRDGTERVVYRKDSLDPIDFTELEMRMFVKGEQDAREFYRNRPIQVFGFAAGVVSGMFGFYGVLGPPIYSTFFGSFSPNVYKKLSYSVGGNAATKAGIEPRKYMNNVTGNVTSPQFTSGDKLKLRCYSVDLNGPLDSAVADINAGFKRHMVHAANVDNKLKFYRTTDPEFLKDNAYREGFEKHVRDYKIRRSALAGLIGLVVTTITFTVLYNND